MKVAAIQHDIVWEQPEKNFSLLSPLIEQAAGDGARLIVLSELFSNGFSMNTKHISETLDGASTQFLIQQATELGVWICGSVPILSRGNDLPHNSLVLADPGGNTLRYEKKHLFGYAGEDKHYVGGSTPLTVEVEGVRCSFFICFDLRFGPDFWDIAAATDVFIVVANWPEVRRNHWKALLKARAIENQAFVLGVNRIGEGDGLTYSGDSRLYGPMGNTISKTSKNETQILLSDIEPSTVTKVRSDFPFRWLNGR